MTWESLQQFLDQPIVDIEGFKITWVLLAKLIVLPIAAILVAKLLRKLVRSGLGRTQMDEGTQNAVSTIAYYLFLALGLSLALKGVGFDWAGLAIFTGGLGLGIGLGFQDVAKNFISGLIMLMSKTIKPGDIISISD